MAVIHRCDRCGYETPANDGLFTIRVPAGRHLDWTVNFDVCKSCLSAVRNVLKPLARATGAAK